MPLLVEKMKSLLFIFLVICLNDVIYAVASWSVLTSLSEAPSDVLNPSDSSSICN